MIKNRVVSKQLETFDPSIYGDVTPAVSDRIPTTLKKRPPKKSVVKRSSSAKHKPKSRPIPGINIQRRSLPPDAQKVSDELLNVVPIPEAVLKETKRHTEKVSEDYSKFLMTRVIPKLLALSSGNIWAQTAMSDGLGIDIDIDNTVTEVVQNLMRLDVITFFLRKSSLPLKYKREFLRAFTEKLSQTCVDGLVKAGRKQERETFIKDLEGVVVKSYSKDIDKKIQDRVSQRASEQQEGGPTIRQNSGILTPERARPAMKRRRTAT